MASCCCPPQLVQFPLDAILGVAVMIQPQVDLGGSEDDPSGKPESFHNLLRNVGILVGWGVARFCASRLRGLDGGGDDVLIPECTHRHLAALGFVVGK